MFSPALVIDLETIPDYGVWTPPVEEDKPQPFPDKCEKCEQDLSEADSASGARKCPKMQRGKCRRPKPVEAGPPKKPFPPRWAHQIAVMGVCYFNDQGIPVSLGCVEATVPQEEKAIIEQFAGMLRNLDPVLVTWRGREFDLPVLYMRALRHGVGLTRSITDVDLIECVGGHRLFSRAGEELTLDSFSRLIGLPGKEGFNGSMVEEAVRGGHMEIVKNYCLRDVVSTSYLYLRQQLTRASITIDQYRTATAALRGLWEPQIPRWSPSADFIPNIDFTRLELL